MVVDRVLHVRKETTPPLNSYYVLLIAVTLSIPQSRSTISFNNLVQQSRNHSTFATASVPAGHHTATSLQLPFLQSTRASLLWGKRLHVPNALRILVNAPITAEETHSRDTGDTLTNPLILVLVRLVNQRLGLIIAVEII
jgi:hypothetical protein